MEKRILILLFFCFMQLNLSSQLMYTRHFTKMLDKGMLEFNTPTEGWFKPVPLIKDEFFQYDLVLQHTNDDFEMRCIIEPTHRANPKNSYPHLLTMRTALSAASNHNSNDLIIQSIPEETLSSTYNADWGLMVDFIPKPSLTDKSFGKMVSLFAEEKSRVFIFFFYNEAEKEDLENRIALFQFE